METLNDIASCKHNYELLFTTFGAYGIIAGAFLTHEMSITSHGLIVVAFFLLIDFYFAVVILEHSSDGPDWRDFMFATNSYMPDSNRFKTSLHKFRLSKDIVRVASQG